MNRLTRVTQEAQKDDVKVLMTSALDRYCVHEIDRRAVTPFQVTDQCTCPMNLDNNSRCNCSGSVHSEVIITCMRLVIKQIPSPAYTAALQSIQFRIRLCAVDRVVHMYTFTQSTRVYYEQQHTKYYMKKGMNSKKKKMHRHQDDCLQQWSFH